MFWQQDLIVMVLACSFGLPFGTTGLAAPQQTNNKAESRPTIEFPESDIFLFDLNLDDADNALSGGRNVTARAGYENQPSFVQDGKSFLFSQSVGGETEIFEYLIESGETRQVASIDGNEFSPQPSPDNRAVSFVTDGPNANMSVWQIQRDSDEPEWVLRHLAEREPIGYYCWNRRTGDLLFWSRYGFSLRLVNTGETETHYVTGDAVPSSPQQIPGTDRFSFVHRQGNGQVWIKELDPQTRSVRPLVAISGSNAHYGWTPDGQILRIQETALNRWSPESGAWSKVADLPALGVASATRLAVSPDGTRIAIVGVPVPADTDN